MKHKVNAVVGLFLCLTIVLGAHGASPAAASQDGDPARMPTRTGAWVDTVQVRTISDTESGISELEAGALDLYAFPIADAAVEARVRSNPDLALHYSYGSYHELTLNPAGPVLNNGKLNPFAVPAIREAMNRLVDRRYVAQVIMRGLGVPKFFPIVTSFPDYVRYRSTAQVLETSYAYDLALAEAKIAAEMVNLGATRVAGDWYYNSEPVTLIFLIRVEDERLEIGDYVADQLERIGFTIDRQYKTSAEASPLWFSSDPLDGLWHLYTGGWITNSVSRDQGANLQFFYTPDSVYGATSPLWQAYTPTPTFADTAARLNDRDYGTTTERDQLFTDALAMSLEDSARVWIVDRHTFTPRRAEVTAAHGQAGGLVGTDLWASTLRFVGQEGGIVDLAMRDLFTDAWNPVAGSNSVYDVALRSATADRAVVSDPIDGLWWPQRLEHADVYVETGLPVTRTHDWLTLTFSPTIEVPGDAWVDWDAVNQEWVTAAEKFTQTQTARTKVVATFPPTLTTEVYWHDGSPFSVADLMMRMIVHFDRAKPDSAIYDGSAQEGFPGFKGFRFTSVDPLVVEWYDDNLALDAEDLVASGAPWANYGYGEGPWHTMALAVEGEAEEYMAFSAYKAGSLSRPHTDFIGEPSISILDGFLAQAQAANHIPYANTLGAYITPAEATARWANLQAWRTAHDHYWLGTGPFYLDTCSPAGGTATLQRFPSFPDDAGKWDHFSDDAAPATMGINYDTGAPGSAFTITGSGFPINTFAEVRVNGETLGTVFTERTGSFVFGLLTTPETDEGLYTLQAGVSRPLVATFALDAAEPERMPEEAPVTFDVPDGIAYAARIFLPLTLRVFQP